MLHLEETLAHAGVPADCPAARCSSRVSLLSHSLLLGSAHLPICTYCAAEIPQRAMDQGAQSATATMLCPRPLGTSGTCINACGWRWYVPGCAHLGFWRYYTAARAYVCVYVRVYRTCCFAETAVRTAARASSSWRDKVSSAPALSSPAAWHLSHVSQR